MLMPTPSLRRRTADRPRASSGSRPARARPSRALARAARRSQASAADRAFPALVRSALLALPPPTPTSSPRPHSSACRQLPPARRQRPRRGA
jgi:hypothetical protein